MGGASEEWCLLSRLDELYEGRAGDRERGLCGL